MRRRLDRVNRTASLVSYEEREESAVPRAKAQRVRRRMHYAMSLQCFQVSLNECACCDVFEVCSPGVAYIRIQGRGFLLPPKLMGSLFADCNAT